MTPLQIALTTIILIFLAMGLIYTFFLLQVRRLQKKENKLLITFNQLENNQAVKREKYINTITINEEKLQVVAKFLKKLIVIYEEKMQITKNNLILLRRLKIRSDFKQYREKITLIEKDIKILEKTIEQIDKHALDSKAFKDGTLTFLIELRKSFVNLEDFYKVHLMPEGYGNEPLYQLIISIKKALEKINDSISSVDADVITSDFSTLIKFIEILTKWITSTFINHKKLEKSKNLFDAANEILKEKNLHFSNEEKKVIDKNLNFYNSNYTYALTQLKLGEISKTEDSINELLKTGFETITKIKLVKEEQALLDDKVFENEVLFKSKFTIDNFKKWIFEIIKNWNTNFQNKSNSAFENSEQLIKDIVELNAFYKTMVQSRESIEQLNNHELLIQNNRLSKTLNSVALNLNNLNQNVKTINDEYSDNVEKLWNLNIKIPQLLVYAHDLLNDNDLTIQVLEENAKKISNLVDFSANGYDASKKAMEDFDEIYHTFKIHKKIIEVKLSEKVLANKLYNYLKIIMLKNNLRSEDDLNFILNLIKRKEWKHAIDSALEKIHEIKAEAIVLEESNNKKTFWKKVKFSKQSGAEYESE